MKKTSLYTILPAIIFFLTGCSGLNETAKILRNEKIKTTDEFLIKKNEPLSQPPNFEKLIKPGTKESKKTTKEKEIKKILKVDTNVNKKTKSTSTENSILKKITK